jgi:hypothetical protein
MLLPICTTLIIFIWSFPYNKLFCYAIFCFCLVQIYWRGEKYLAPTGIWTPNRPSCRLVTIPTKLLWPHSPCLCFVFFHYCSYKTSPLYYPLLSQLNRDHNLIFLSTSVALTPMPIPSLYVQIKLYLPFLVSPPITHMWADHLIPGLTLLWVNEQT